MKWAEDTRDYDLAHIPDAPEHETHRIIQTPGQVVIMFDAATGRMRGIPQTEAMRVTERFTRVDENTINYTVTIEDPKVYTRPWTVSLPLNRDESYQFFEYSCHEGNYALANALRYGRTRDQEAAASSR